MYIYMCVCGVVLINILTLQLGLQTKISISAPASKQLESEFNETSTSFIVTFLQLTNY